MAKKKIVNIFEDYEVLWKFVKGTTKWVNIIEPDDYDSWSLNMYGEEAEDLAVEVQAYLDEAVKFAKGKGKDVQLIQPILKKDNEGKQFLKFKKRKYDGDTKPPKVYNKTGEEVTGTFNDPIGGGSLLRVKALIKPYYMGTNKSVGVSMQLLAVQVIKNVEYAGSSGFVDESSSDNPPFETEDASDY